MLRLYCVHGVVQDAVHEQQRNAALILRGGSAGSGPEAGPGSAPDNAGQCRCISAWKGINSSPFALRHLAPPPHPLWVRLHVNHTLQNGALVALLVQSPGLVGVLPHVMSCC